MSFYTPTSRLKLAGKILVIPVVSVANVPQLAVDLLITSLALSRVGVFDPKLLVPVVGAREDGLPGITTPLELYASEAQNIAVIQQRSPTLKAFKQEFVDALLQFISASGASAALFLGSVDMSNRTDSQMLTPTCHIIPTTSAPITSSPLSTLTELPIPAYISPVPQFTEAGIDDQRVPFIPGGGLSRRILSSIPHTWQIPTASLLQYVMEGDNRDDAQLMAAVTSKVLASDVQIWKQPSSWSQGLFGAPHDQTLYG
ncbi:PAC2 family-domain-containing protein [Hygrophoropsis aurantiaca]|uniref:PAC2 family-domain-containing protein n=1 Tax=Hygrophoropsis aurantiaca TaxID=72124 RepID=A0ACB8AU41_9AGAM|nr:PAC2 family-domain-containing protein [Hygrophoropsis aurantiaca]